MDTLAFLNNLLSSAQFLALRALFIVFDFGKTEDFDVSDPDRQQAWTTLETTLSLPRYATLQHTTIRFFVWNSIDKHYYPVQEEVVKAALPKLISRRNVDLTPLPFLA